jgi:hypothetical protein
LERHEDNIPLDSTIAAKTRARAMASRKKIREEQRKRGTSHLNNHDGSKKNRTKGNHSK